MKIETATKQAVGNAAATVEDQSTGIPRTIWTSPTGGYPHEAFLIVEAKAARSGIPPATKNRIARVP